MKVEEEEHCLSVVEVGPAMVAVEVLQGIHGVVGDVEQGGVGVGEDHPSPYVDVVEGVGPEACVVEGELAC